MAHLHDSEGAREKKIGSDLDLRAVDPAEDLRGTDASRDASESSVKQAHDSGDIMLIVGTVDARSALHSCYSPALLCHIRAHCRPHRLQVSEGWPPKGAKRETHGWSLARQNRRML